MKLNTRGNTELANLTKTINETLPDIVEKSHYFRQDTQHSISFQSLTMLNGQHPMRLLRQIMAEISKRRNALLESHDSVTKFENKINKAKSPIKKIILENQLIELHNSIANAVKDIKVLTSRYEQVSKKHGINEWTELDFEEAEASFHVRRGFELLYQNLVQFGRPEKSIIEYLQQHGIHPQVATREVGGYIALVESLIEQKEYVTSSHLEDFLDEMMSRYKDRPKDVSERMFGTRELVIKDALIPTIENVVSNNYIGNIDNN